MNKFIKYTVAPLRSAVKGSSLITVETPETAVTVDVCPKKLWQINLW